MYYLHSIKYLNFFFDFSNYQLFVCSIFNIFIIFLAIDFQTISKIFLFDHLEYKYVKQ